MNLLHQGLKNSLTVLENRTVRPILVLKDRGTHTHSRTHINRQVCRSNVECNSLQMLVNCPPVTTFELTSLQWNRDVGRCGRIRTHSSQLPSTKMSSLFRKLGGEIAQLPITRWFYNSHDIFSLNNGKLNNSLSTSYFLYLFDMKIEQKSRIRLYKNKQQL